MKTISRIGKNRSMTIRDASVPLCRNTLLYIFRLCCRNTLISSFPAGEAFPLPQGAIAYPVGLLNHVSRPCRFPFTIYIIIHVPMNINWQNSQTCTHESMHFTCVHEIVYMLYYSWGGVDIGNKSTFGRK